MATPQTTKERQLQQLNKLNIMITTIQGVCSLPPCTNPATHIACGRAHTHTYRNVEGKPSFTTSAGHPVAACYCEQHALQVANESDPEYINQCPNCLCLSGVNCDG